MDFVVADFFDKYPEFVGKFTDNKIDYEFETAKEISTAIWSLYLGDDKRQRIQYLALAHALQLILVPVSGVVTSANQGSVSASFDYYDKTVAGAYWKQTNYGRQLWQYRRAVGTIRYVK